MESGMVSRLTNAANIWIFVTAMVLVLSSVYKMYKTYRRPKYVEKQDQDNILLSELVQSSSPETKANIIVSLIVIGYILIHKLINSGSKYDDNQQRKRFKKFLSKESVDKLNSLGGNENECNPSTI